MGIEHLEDYYVQATLKLVNIGWDKYHLCHMGGTVLKYGTASEIEAFIATYNDEYTDHAVWTTTDTLEVTTLTLDFEIYVEQETDEDKDDKQFYVGLRWACGEPIESFGHDDKYTAISEAMEYIDKLNTPPVLETKPSVELEQDLNTLSDDWAYITPDQCRAGLDNGIDVNVHREEQESGTDDIKISLASCKRDTDGMLTAGDDWSTLYRITNVPK